MVDEVSQLLYSCFEIVRGKKPRSRIAEGDPAVMVALVVALESSCASPASCRHVKPLGDGDCKWRTAFVCGSLCLSVRGEDTRSISVGTCKSCAVHREKEI